ncbi:hypothetical protein FB45DRAFT_1010133 [Roridomyces roridus]|uniref:DUF6535 domain-containing protein n=1 Tax=Roridomyces roridus TaxID=1738132 RepID=A0AAD7F935_9AGAR|nr:hypothetical protein FB45DRAFT_1010133 [Roridomyces roridus]
MKSSAGGLEAGIPPSHPSQKVSLLRRLGSTASRLLGRTRRTASWHSGPWSQFKNGLKSSTVETETPYSEADNEESCAKLWSIYVEEAERYDSALVESWRADMEGILIFSGLFSASLTAFLVESYKTLRPDSGDLTVSILSQISLQLAGEPVVLRSTSQFTPTAASLLCNTLWFISLSLSLICALLATLVEQWAREFMHKTEIRPSPVRRAKIFAFLYFGLKQFHMHTVVDTIPSLLHGALLLFFAGLVAFLVPINHLIMYFIAGALLVFVLLYSSITVLPVLYLHCPYRTPLSTLLWSMVQKPLAILRKPTFTPPNTVAMAEAVVDSALQDTKERDQHALQWTLESLTDDVELLPFVEAIPSIIYGPHGFRLVNDYLLHPMLGTTDVPSPLVTRICNLVLGAQTLPADDPLAPRRRVAGLKALWALCMMPRAREHLFETRLLPKGRWLDESLDGTCYAAAILAIQYHQYGWGHHLLTTLRGLLTTDPNSPCFRNDVLPTVMQRLHLVVAYEDVFLSRPGTTALEGSRNIHSPSFGAWRELESLVTEIGDFLPDGRQLSNILRAVNALALSYDWASTCVDCIGRFLQDGFAAVERREQVFEPNSTCTTILREIGSHHSVIVHDAGLSIAFPSALHTFPFAWNISHPLDDLARVSFSLLSLLGYKGHLRPAALVKYLVERKNVLAIDYALSSCDLHALASSFGDYLFDNSNKVGGPSATRTVHAVTVVAECLRNSEAIKFVNNLLAGRTADSIEFSSIRAIHHFRHISQIEEELRAIHQWPPSTILSRLQEICREELFIPYSPRLLPADDTIAPLFTQSLLNILSEIYLSSLTTLLCTTTPTSPKPPMSWLSTTFVAINWAAVPAHIQYDLFEAILAYCRTFLAPQRTQFREHSDSLASFDESLWTAGIFRSQKDIQLYGYEYNVRGIELPCLRMLLEALELYRVVVGEGDTTALLFTLRKEIAEQEN